MSVTAIQVTQMNPAPFANEHRVKRKSAPSPASIRYPEPDPGDPFAPLALLRSRGINSSRISILDNPDGSPGPRRLTISASLQPIHISNKASFAGLRPYSQDVGSMLEMDFPTMDQKCHYRRRTESIGVYSECSPHTPNNLQTYVLPITPSPEEGSQDEVSTPSTMGNDSSTAVSCALETPGDNSSVDHLPTSLSRNRKSTASFTKPFGIIMPRRSRNRSTLSIAQPISVLPPTTSPLPGLLDRESCQPGDSIRSVTGTLPVTTPQEPASDHERVYHARRRSDFFTFPQSSESSLARHMFGLPRSRTSSADPTRGIRPFTSPSPYIVNRPSSTIRPGTCPDQHARIKPSRILVPDLQEGQMPPGPPAIFDENKRPTKKQLSDAASLIVIAENGLRVAFGDLWREQKTVVLFIRHFWCPLCQDYMFSISANVDPAMLKEAGVDLVIISNGSYKMIKFYREIFRCPFALYTDPTLKLYAAMGMTIRKADGEHDLQRGGYVRHGPMGGIAMVITNALRVGMPVWAKGGDVSQLGGEFILGPGLECTFAHRMRTKRGHLPIVRVLMAAGLNTVSSPVVLVRPSEPVPPDVPQEAEERKNNARGRMTKRGREMWCITNYEVDSLSGDSEEESYREEVVYKERGRTLTKTEPITRMT